MSEKTCKKSVRPGSPGQQDAPSELNYETYNPLRYAKLSMNCFTSLVDERLDYLPYWLVNMGDDPAYAQHCRVDDAEICASWAEGLMLMQGMLGTKDGDEVLAGLTRHTVKGFKADGLHYNSSFPWTDHIFASMHEQAYIASFLSTWLEQTGNPEAEKYMHGLVRGLLKIKDSKELVTFWGGTYPQPRKSYFYRGDAIYDGIGFDLTKTRGSGEEATRNAPMIDGIMRYYELTGDAAAIDLAEGMINYSVIESRLHGYREQFDGHVHTNIWIACGLARLARVTGDKTLKAIAYDIYQFGKKISSSFGHVPEFAHIRHPGHCICESCCIKDMIELAFEMIKLGYDEWDLIDRFARNQLVENQIRTVPDIIVDNSREETDAVTFRDIGHRLVGSFTGNAFPNYIPIQNRRAIAGCCSGIAPQAHYMVWDNIVTFDNGETYINLPIDRTHDAVDVRSFYPNEGRLSVNAKKASNYRVRVPEWAGQRVTALVDERPVPLLWQDNYLVFNGIRAGQTIDLVHRLEDVEKEETCCGTNLTVTWRGSHVIKMLPNPPHAATIPLFQREPERSDIPEGSMNKTRIVKATEKE
jgi:hypothetical protein